jgi:hypothetical protein
MACWLLKSGTSLHPTRYLLACGLSGAFRDALEEV